MKLLILHGPNLNLLGEREPEIYGDLTLADVNREIAALCTTLSVTAAFHQSNHEGALIDRLHDYRASVDGVVFNPGGYTHTSVALRDAIAAIKPPVVEVHLSHIQGRETFRQKSMLADVCVKAISGLGLESYLAAVRFLVQS